MDTFYPQEILNSEYVSVENEDGKLISMVEVHKTDVEEKIANTNLIASAPEMYEIEHEYAALLWEIQNFIVEDEEDEKKLRKLQVVADRKTKILSKARGEISNK